MAAKRFVRPIVEFFEFEYADAPRSDNAVLFSEMWDEKTHRYLDGVKKELQRARGIYIYYDSRGRAIYAGKAEEQSLWKEMNLALNRGRGDVQSIKRVSHPTNSIPYKAPEEKSRRIVRQEVRLWEIARYFSAYEIAPRSIIGMFEALMVRGFANDLLNKRMETL
jgi:hypothetical protein